MGVMARLRAGRTALDAQQELGMVYRQLQAEHPGTTSDWTARVMPLRELMLGDSRRVLLILGAATLVLIVVASINVAGLLLDWLPSRRQEFLVRMAIGASVSRVVRQLFVETLTCAIAGMAGGGLLAVSFVRLFGAVGLSPTLEYDFEPSLDTRVILTMCVLVLVNVAVTGLVPCVMSVKRSRDLVPRRAWATGVLGHRVAIAMQVALSVVLLGATADLLAGFQKLASIAKQGAAAGLAVDVSLSERRYPEENNQRQFFERLLSALATRQEIQAVAAANYLPPARIYGNIRFEIEGRSTPSDELTTLASAVSPGVFKSLGIALLRGRWIDDRDRPEAPRAGVISSALMRRYWPNEDPLGRRIALVFDPVPITIVGVVDDVRQPLSTDARAESMLYLSYRQVPSSFMSILFVPAGGAAPAVAAVREEVKRIDPAQAAGPARAIDEIRAEWLEQPRLRTRIVTLFGVSTLLLTLVGLYARVAYAASSRAREFAIRQALGARPSDVIRILTTEALAVVSAGLVTGLALLPAASSAVRSIVGGMPRIGIGLAGAIAALFSMAAFGSAYWPARRIGQLNPAGLLRSE